MQSRGELKLSAGAEDTIGAREAELKDDILQEADSSNYQPPAGKPIKSGRRHRKRDAVSPNDALELIMSGLSYFSKAGGSYAVVSLPQRIPHAVGMVLSNVWACEKCRRLVYGEKSEDGRCSIHHSN